MFKMHGTIGKVWTSGTHMPNMNAQSLAVKKLWPTFKSKKGLVIRNTFAKYESLISYKKDKKVMGNDKVC